jgi:hypothetical protein
MALQRYYFEIIILLSLEDISKAAGHTNYFSALLFFVSDLILEIGSSRIGMS